LPGRSSARSAASSAEGPGNARLDAGGFFRPITPRLLLDRALERALCARFTALGYAHHFPMLPRPLYLTGVDIDTAERLVFGTGELAHVHVCRAVAASSAIPIFFEPIRIGERDVVDGAIAGVPPIDVAAERGARHIVYVNPLVPIRNDRGKVWFPTR